jgi:hypothetical protein
MKNNFPFFEIILKYVERPGMFGIQKVEDIRLLFVHEEMFHKVSYVGEFNAKFNKYVSNELGPGLENFDWSKIIRLHSGSDFHSIQLFEQVFVKFLEQSGDLGS